MAANTPAPQAGSRNQKFQYTFVFGATNAKTDYSVKITLRVWRKRRASFEAI